MSLSNFFQKTDKGAAEEAKKQAFEKLRSSDSSNSYLSRSCKRKRDQNTPKPEDDGKRPK